MSDITSFSNEKSIESFYGSPSDVRTWIAAVEQNADLKVVALAFSKITNQQAMRFSNAFKNSPAVHQYLYGDIDPEFYDFVVNALLPKAFPIPTLVIQEKLLTEAKRQMVESGDFATAEQIIATAKLSAVSSRIRPAQWGREQLIFSFMHEGVTYFPVYALRPDKRFSPNPAISVVLEIFGTHKGGWECAVWFASANISLGDLTPKEVLESDPTKIIYAAHMEMILG